ncbi:MAG: methyltransferase domain-containing protein [Terracidiphilus sp.]
MKRFVARMKMDPIPVEACLLGDENGTSAATFARMSGDLLRASRPISEWPHVKLLRQFERLGSGIWDQGVFEETPYFRNAAFNIEIFGHYFDAVTPDEVRGGARRFIRACFGEDRFPGPAQPPDWERDPDEHVTARRVKYSSCFQVRDGHHRLAAAYVKGQKTVQGFILEPAVTTPLQDLLLDVLWLKGRRELYQPIDSPEVADWALVRHCTDRAAKMLDFLRAQNSMPPASRSYLDVACSYGWFVKEMSKSGFAAQGVESDPTAILVGQLMYGLRTDQIHRSDAVSFLKSNRTRFDVVSCFSLAHHFLLHRHNSTIEDLLHLLDAATGSILFFDMGEAHEHEFWGNRLEGWNADHIHNWLKENTTFKEIRRLGKDKDAVPPFQSCYSRTLFACTR